MAISWACGCAPWAVLNKKKIICGKLAFLQSEGVVISEQQKNEIEKIKKELQEFEIAENTKILDSISKTFLSKLQNKTA